MATVVDHVPFAWFSAIRFVMMVATESCRRPGIPPLCRGVFHLAVEAAFSRRSYSSRRFEKNRHTGHAYVDQRNSARMSDHSRDGATDGLTEQEAETAVRDLTKNWPDAQVSIRTTKDGVRFVVATQEGAEGEPETRTVCRERGRYVILDTNGCPILETDVFPLSRI